MASNFKMLVGGKGKSLRVKLVGDFDGTSAHQIADFVNRRSKRGRAIYIDTSNLRTIYPFGLDVLKSDLADLKERQTVKVTFTGPHATELAPYGRYVM